MKALRLLIIISTLGLSGFVYAGGGHSHGHDHGGHGHSHGEGKLEAGPNGGRYIEKAGLRLEFWVKADGFVQVTYLDKERKAIAPGEGVFSLIGGKRTNPIRLKFEKKGDVFLSHKSLEPKQNMPIVFQVKSSKKAKPQLEKFNLDLMECSHCGLQEYACDCH